MCIPIVSRLHSLPTALLGTNSLDLHASIPIQSAVVVPADDPGENAETNEVSLLGHQ